MLVLVLLVVVLLRVSCTAGVLVLLVVVLLRGPGCGGGLEASALAASFALRRGLRCFRRLRRERAPGVGRRLRRACGRRAAAWHEPRSKLVELARDATQAIAHRDDSSLDGRWLAPSWLVDSLFLQHLRISRLADVHGRLAWSWFRLRGWLRAGRPVRLEPVVPLAPYRAVWCLRLRAGGLHRELRAFWAGRRFSSRSPETGARARFRLLAVALSPRACSRRCARPRSRCRGARLVSSPWNMLDDHVAFPDVFLELVLDLVVLHLRVSSVFALDLVMAPVLVIVVVRACVLAVCLAVLLVALLAVLLVALLPLPLRRRAAGRPEWPTAFPGRGPETGARARRRWPARESLVQAALRAAWSPPAWRRALWLNGPELRLPAQALRRWRARVLPACIGMPEVALVAEWAFTPLSHRSHATARLRRTRRTSRLRRVSARCSSLRRAISAGLRSQVRGGAGVGAASGSIRCLRAASGP